jgi:hypothetical protein
MPTYTLTLTFRGDKDQKSHLESVTGELQRKGGRILNITSKVGRAVDQTTFNVVTITYEAPIPIKYQGQ